MTNQTKILIGILVVLVILVGGLFVYNKLLIPEKPIVPERPTPEKPAIPSERVSPKLSVSIPSRLEMTAYKSFSFNFSFGNERGYPEAKDVNITLTLGETSILVTPNNVNIASGESQNFKAEFNKIPPGDFNLYLKIEGKPDISISKIIPLKSQIVVGLDEYHVGRIPCWEKGTTVFRAVPLGTTNFLEYLGKENIKTEIFNSRLTTETLKNINVLIIAYPTQPISISEKEAIKKFLNQGGGLLLAASHLQKETEEIRTFAINDLAVSLNLPLKFSTRFCTFDDFSNVWVQEIIGHPVTSGINAVLRQCGTLDTDLPLISLVKQDGKGIYAIQYYSNGKIGAIASGEVFTNQVFDTCHQCQELNLNLIKWLATPPTPEEIETLG